jgi:hypothetical protein
MTTMGLRPAYGRDYKSKAAIGKDLAKGLDFIETRSERYIALAEILTLSDPPKFLTVRYKGLRSVCSFSLADLKKLGSTVVEVSA